VAGVRHRWIFRATARISRTNDARGPWHDRPGTADIGFIPSINAVIVPHMNENTLAAYELP
jgi:hypothetical protein